MPNSRITYPAGHVALRSLTKNYPVVSYGKGVELFDADGKRYLDASGGALVVSLGHGNTEITEEIAAQISRVAYVNGMQFTSQVMEEFADKMASIAKPIGLDRVGLLASGSEAVEAAIKFARQLCVDRGEPERTKLIARTPGYHGNTLFALSASGRPHYKKIYGPLLSEVHTVSTPYEYRSVAENFNADFYAHELEDLISREGAKTIMAFIFETVSGSSCGGATPPAGYFDRVQEICRKNGILMIADEVMCGSGRTDKFFAAEHYNLQPDILTLGKGINSGYAPVSAFLVKTKDLDVMKSKSGYFMHAQTYMHSPSMAATSLAVLNYMEKYQVLKHAQSTGPAFQNNLRTKMLDLPGVGNVSGIGHIAGVEFVANKTTRAAFPRALKIVENFVAHAQENHGLLLWPNVGQANGVDGDLVMLGPALTASEAELSEMVQTLSKAIQDFKWPH